VAEQAMLIVPSYYRARSYDPSEGRFLSEDPWKTGGDDVDFYWYSSDDRIILPGGPLFVVWDAGLLT
jgi:RHS repeat-associated protein